MTKLSDTQAIILSAAAQRADRNALPFPPNIRGGAAAKVVRALLSRKLIEEVAADIRKGEPVWRETGDGHGVTLVATEAGLAAIGIEPEGAGAAPNAEAAESAKAETEPKVRRSRSGTKQERLIEMLRAEGGATLNEIVAATGWQPHTVRGAMSGALKKKLGLQVSSEKIEHRGRVYKLSH
ncbi:hypothetical protein JSE7799_02051 [Jannaschia seosinensis]|uniref:DUF3489 domain-containing protein n=1 Tax=Jannaschia seosinensis TaxID=313367 RepID=A0A0M7B964_9RHOB|nr:DUF3489 domain-containing protein [Jannaschia seosinensis]CUH39327.1 hypothetical protein JSE7799_02051 [Jannaschia seosinensis]